MFFRFSTLMINNFWGYISFRYTLGSSVDSNLSYTNISGQLDSTFGVIMYGMIYDIILAHTNICISYRKNLLSENSNILSKANNPLLIKRTVIKIQINVAPQICKIIWVQRSLQKGYIPKLETIRIASQRRHTNN